MKITVSEISEMIAIVTPMASRVLLKKTIPILLNRIINPQLTIANQEIILRILSILFLILINSSSVVAAL